MFSVKTVVAFTALRIVNVQADHTMVFKNNCAYTIQPAIVSVSCGYSPRCSTLGSGGVPNPAIPYTGSQPAQLAAGASISIKVNRQFNGRVFAKTSKCGAKGENCSMGEFNLDTGSQWTPQAYNIANIQGFTQFMQIAVNGCDTVTCRTATCPCNQAFPIGI